MVLWLTMHKPHGAQDVDDGYFILAPVPLSDGTLWKSYAWTMCLDHVGSAHLDSHRPRSETKPWIAILFQGQAQDILRP